MKQKFLRTLTVLLAVVMVLSLAACGKTAEPAATTDQPAAETAPSAESAARALSLTDVSFSVTTWSSPNGATVHVTAVPSEHAKGDSAEFVVRLDGEDVTSAPCEWKDNAYMGSAELNGADGYSYYLTISGKDGSGAALPVNTPEAPVDEAVGTPAA